LEKYKKRWVISKAGKVKAIQVLPFSKFFFVWVGESFLDLSDSREFNSIN